MKITEDTLVATFKVPVLLTRTSPIVNLLSTTACPNLFKINVFLIRAEKFTEYYQLERCKLVFKIPRFNYGTSQLHTAFTKKIKAVIKENFHSTLVTFLKENVRSI